MNSEIMKNLERLVNVLEISERRDTASSYEKEFYLSDKPKRNHGEKVKLIYEEDEVMEITLKEYTGGPILRRRLGIGEMKNGRVLGYEESIEIFDDDYSAEMNFMGSNVDNICEIQLVHFIDKSRSRITLGRISKPGGLSSMQLDYLNEEDLQVVFNDFVREVNDLIENKKF